MERLTKQLRVIINTLSKTGNIMNKLFIFLSLSLFNLAQANQEANIKNSYEIYFCSPYVNPDFYINGKFQGNEYAIVSQDTEFKVVAELGLPSNNFGKWSLVSCEPFLLVSEKYKPRQYCVTAHNGIQQWKLKSTVPGDYLLLFERTVNNEKQQKIISVHVQ